MREIQRYAKKTVKSRFLESEPQKIQYPRRQNQIMKGGMAESRPLLLGEPDLEGCGEQIVKIGSIDLGQREE
jgi:hypothetical protein